MNIEQAYEECDRITRAEAKNFSYGIRLLPTPKRNAMSALYAYARRIDDIADGDSSADHKLTALAAVDEQVAGLAEGRLPDQHDPVLVGVHDATERFGVPVATFGEIVEGCRRDSLGTEYASTADTEEYCRLVAGSVGRLSLGVFGSSDPVAPRLADDLGVALQLTNILRDIVEDRDEMGRIYLAKDDIDRFGCHHDLSGPEDAMTALIEAYIDTAQQFYAIGLDLLPLLDRRSRSCVSAMAGIYRRLLVRISEDPLVVMRGRLSLSTREKLIVAGRSLAGLSP